MKRTLIQNAVIVNEGRKVLGSVVIENEKPSDGRSERTDDHAGDGRTF